MSVSTVAAPAKRRVLVVDDEDNVTHLVSSALRFDGFETVTADTGTAALAAVAEQEPDLIVLDVMMPGLDGLGVLHSLRSAGSQVPVIFLTARDAASDRVGGLRGGADDYVVKPFGFAELVARMEAVLRRSRPVLPVPAPARPLVRLADVEIDLDARTVRAHGGPVRLTRKEFDLLALLAEQPGAVRTRAEILQRVWESPWQGPSRTLDVHVSSLRAKLGAPDLVETVRGVGYRLRSG
jgi:two-component system OmpR family response regulator